LRFRREHPELFAGGYTPVDVVGPQAGHAFAFARVSGASCALVVVPRLVATLLNAEERVPLGPQVWGDTALMLPPDLPAARWTNTFTGEVFDTPADRTLRLAQVFNSFPVALLGGHR
jgi:(1->4)-alpha-D-glucan 1-alpha-D-glucosylmutase